MARAQGAGSYSSAMFHNLRARVPFVSCVYGPCPRPCPALIENSRFPIWNLSRRLSGGDTSRCLLLSVATFFNDFVVIREASRDAVHTAPAGRPGPRACEPPPAAAPGGRELDLLLWGPGRAGPGQSLGQSAECMLTLTCCQL